MYVKDQNENPVALDSFEVIDLENENKMTILLSPPEYNTAQENGAYPLVNDGSLDINQKKQIRFKGYINNQEVINQNYNIGKDCCHIYLISGAVALSL